jgi:transposase
MARRQGLAELEGWLAGAEASDLPQLRSFARGIRRDQQAVTAGLSLPYSSAAMRSGLAAGRGVDDTLR